MDLYQPFENKTLLITGGSGSFGKAFIHRLLSFCNPKKVIIFSRDEWKHSLMQEDPVFQHPTLRFFLGDIRDKERLKYAFRGVDYLVHAAALKQVPAAEYNPSEFIKTNVLGTLNILEAAIDEGIQKVALLSTDKAVSPINLYGATKLCAEKLILSSSVYVGDRPHPKFCVVRYGNVLGSRGSLIPKWKKLIDEGADALPITDMRMTRFWMTLERAVDFVASSMIQSQGGEVFVPKIPSMRIVDLARALAPDLALKSCGIRPGEKLHERLITPDEAAITVEHSDRYILHTAWSSTDYQSNVDEGFEYVSDQNTDWLTAKDLEAWISPQLNPV